MKMLPTNVILVKKQQPKSLGRPEMYDFLKSIQRIQDLNIR